MASESLLNTPYNFHLRDCNKSMYLSQMAPQCIFTIFNAFLISFVCGSSIRTLCVRWCLQQCILLTSYSLLQFSHYFSDREFLSVSRLKTASPSPWFLCLLQLNKSFPAEPAPAASSCVSTPAPRGPHYSNLLPNLHPSPKLLTCMLCFQKKH